MKCIVWALGIFASMMTFVSWASVPVVAIPDYCPTNSMVTAKANLVKAVEKGGFASIVVAFTEDDAKLSAALAHVDALMIGGGIARLQDYQRRCEFEQRAIRIAIKRGIPIVGVCHGSQILNMYFGGTIKPTPAGAEPSICHKKAKLSGERDNYHEAIVEPNTLIALSLGSGKVTINSSHKMRSFDLGKGLKVTARAADGVVEAFEHEALPICGFQFHPERMTDDPKFVDLIRRSLLPREKHRISMVHEAIGYNSWPMIQSVDERLVCAYSRGSAHTIAEGKRGVFARMSMDQGKTWSDEVCVVNDPNVGEVTIGKGLDSTGAMLLWVRIWSGTEKHHDLYRTFDGITFTRISMPKLDPVPMQITDIFHVPGVGLMSLWFSDGYKEGADKSWGVVTSPDDGRTWKQRMIERGLQKADWPTEQSAAYLGDGRIIVVARSEGATKNQVQLTSTDYGQTWKRERTNIRDVAESTPSLIYDPSNGQISNYYYHRGARQLKRRVANADYIFTHPMEWPQPEVFFEGKETRAFDAGNVNATRLGDMHFVATYTGSTSDTCVVAVQITPPKGK